MFILHYIYNNPAIILFTLIKTVPYHTFFFFLNSRYMAPEYAMERLFSIKSDVYSFGILILEIVSGKKNSSFYHPKAF